MTEKIYIKDFINLIIMHKKPLSIIMVISLLGFVQLSYILPKTYRSEFELNIYTKYFKNALIGEVIPGMNSISEMTQTIDSMVKETLDDNFIDQIGYDYKIYAKKTTPLELAKSRELLRGRFLLYSTGGLSYKISFSYNDPLITFQITKRVLNSVRDKFINSRIETIEVAKKTIQQKLESLNVTKQMSDDSMSANALASKNPHVLRSEIEKINADLGALKMQFNISHPRILKLLERKTTIQNWLNNLENKDDRPGGMEYADAPLLMAGNNEISETITSKLFTKFNDINIALDIERKSLPGYIGIITAPQIPTSPLFPKKRIFASLGFVLGLLICFGYVFYQEVMELRPIDRARKLAFDLKSEYFGQMPYIDEEQLMTNKKIIWKNENQIEDFTYLKSNLPINHN